MPCLSRRLLLACAVAAFVPVTAGAGSMPPDVAEKIAVIGRVIAPPQTNAIYAPLLQVAPFAGIKIARDVKYGSDELNVLDVMTAENATGGPRPVLVLIHGGGFSRGDKYMPGTAFLDNVPVWAARNGMVGVNINYRLAPKATWPSGPQDLAATINWLRANAASYGGDASRIYMIGLSAGAGHVAAYLGFPEYHAVPGSGLAGAILVSGSPLDTTTFDMKPYDAYFGSDASKYAAMSPTPGLLKSQVPLMITHAGFDPPGIDQQSVDLIDTLCKAQKCPTKVFLKTHNHVSQANSIGTDDTELSDQIATFVRPASQ